MGFWGGAGLWRGVEEKRGRALDRCLRPVGEVVAGAREGAAAGVVVPVL